MTHANTTPTGPAGPHHAAPLYLSEEETRELLSEELALKAARSAFTATADSTPSGSLVMRGSDPVNRFSVKPGVSPEAACVKIGTFWVGNEEHGLPRHHSTVLIMNQIIGRVGAVLELGAGNAYRTAAADALAVQLLANPGASTLAIFGTGHQALYEVRAVARVRPITRVLVVGRHPERTRSFSENLLNEGFSARQVTAREACAEADVMITATTSTIENPPLFEASWVRPGTHISAMGADGPGKRELPTALLEQAELFCDVPEQSRQLGEFKYAPDGTELAALGLLLTGAAAGRSSTDAVTVFDSSGFGLQDLYLGLAVLGEKGLSATDLAERGLTL